MTELRAKVLKYELIPHPNADLLSIAKIKGWQCIVKTAEMIGKNLGIYFPIDSLLDTSRPEFSFLKNKSKNGKARIKTIRLRGALSQGLLLPAPEGAQEEDDYTEAFGVERWEPEVPLGLRGDLIRQPGNFPNYTSIENYKNFPDVFQNDEMVRITEKIHGTSARYGLINDGSIGELKFYVGSHKTSRDPVGENFYSQIGRKLLLEEKIKELGEILNPTFNLIIFGEIYGSKVQDLTYDCQIGEQRFRIFDVMLDEVFQPWEVVEWVGKHLNIETVPILYRGPFSLDRALAFRDGVTTIGGCIREGVVVTAEPEIKHPEVGRKILKFISDDYLLRHNATDGH